MHKVDKKKTQLKRTLRTNIGDLVRVPIYREIESSAEIEGYYTSRKKKSEKIVHLEVGRTVFCTSEKPKKNSYFLKTDSGGYIGVKRLDKTPFILFGILICLSFTVTAGGVYYANKRAELSKAEKLAALNNAKQEVDVADYDGAPIDLAPDGAAAPASDVDMITTNVYGDMSVTGAEKIALANPKENKLNFIFVFTKNYNIEYVKMEGKTDLVPKLVDIGETVYKSSEPILPGTKENWQASNYLEKGANKLLICTCVINPDDGTLHLATWTPITITRN